MSKPTLITSRDDKGLHATKIWEDAYNQAKLTDDRAQRLNENGGQLKAGLQKLIEELSATNQFANEEVRSNYTYPADFKVKPIAEQVTILQQHFSKLSGADLAIASQPLPNGAEGYYAIPRWESIGSTYGEAVEKLLAIIAKQRKFYNYRSGKLTEKYLRQHARTSHALDLLAEQQPTHDILVVAAQFGLKHRGRSVRRAREVFASNEFGLGAFAIACMLVTHPERLVAYENLWIDCAGDEYSPGADGQFEDAPDFSFYDGRLGFGAHWVSDAYDSYGSASGFSPQ